MVAKEIQPETTSREVAGDTGAVLVMDTKDRAGVTPAVDGVVWSVLVGGLK